MFGFSSTWFIEGFLHPFVTPSHILLLIGLGIFLGQQGAVKFVRNLLFFATALMIGLTLNQLLSIKWNSELILLITALLISLLVVLRLNTQRGWVQLITLISACTSGLMIGMDTSPVVIPGLGQSTFYNWLFGAAMGVYLIILSSSLIAFLIRKLLDGIVLRVLGSWIATSSLIVLALLISKGS